MRADPLEALTHAERRWQAAQLTSDVTTLGELLDDDAIFTGSDGNLYAPTPGSSLRCPLGGCSAG